ncbi:MAG: ABC transporter substrate-binding protein [bacterium]|nr:ABC transporter substrate-binding protein [bacterium]
MRNLLKIFLSLIVVTGLVLVFYNSSFSQERVSPNSYNLTDYEKLTGKKITKFKEAPMLAELVKQGKLPPVEQRLPKEPLVVKVVEEIGQYGGTWRRAWLGPADGAGVDRLLMEPLLRYDSSYKKVPQLAKSWKVSRDGKVFTFYLREGVKWSDGIPFTAEDVIFYYEDILLNKELTPVIPDWMQIDGTIGKVEKIDDYTVRFVFEKPYGFFIEQFSQIGGKEFYAPKHYLKQFHPKYTPKEKLDSIVKESGFQAWYQLFSQKMDQRLNPDRPTLRAWKLKTSATAPLVIYERNPFYWKIDPEGNQLPYIDRIQMSLMENKDMINLKAMTGELDFQHRHIIARNYTLFKENEKKGDYRVLRWKGCEGANFHFMFNQNYSKDPVLLQFLRNDKFRKALSLAINREEINQICFLGLGKPRQFSIISGLPYYDSEWEKLYAEYDPKRANELLDQIGLRKRDKDGFRLRPDGKVFSITLDATPWSGVEADVLELVKKYWEAIGIKVYINIIERSLYNTRVQANEVALPVWSCNGNFYGALRRLVPVYIGIDTWANEYTRWYLTGGKSGERPDRDIARLFELYNKLLATANEKERDAIAKAIINLHKKNLWFVGIVGEVMELAIVKNNFRNVPETLLCDWFLYWPRNAEPEQFFIKQ